MNKHLNSALILSLVFTLISVGYIGVSMAETASVEIAQNESEDQKKEEKLDSILKNYREAVGGKKAWDSMNTLILKGNMHSLGTVFKTTVAYQRPGMCRLDFKAENMSFVESYDGTIPWQKGISAREKEPTELKGKRAQELKQTCDFDGPLVDYEEKDIEIEYMGEEEIEEQNGYKLKVTYKNGSTDTYYLNTETYLPFMVIGETTLRNKNLKSTTRIGDFIQTGDIIIAYRYEFELEGIPTNEVFKVTSVEINPEIKKGYFSMPRDVKDSY